MLGRKKKEEKKEEPAKEEVKELSPEDKFREEIKALFLERKVKGLVIVLNENDTVNFSWMNIYAGRALDALANATAQLRSIISVSKS